MTPQTILAEAYALSAEITANRRLIHQFAEIGFELPQTTAFVMAKLSEYGYTPRIVGRSGLVCCAGARGKTFLLRADMDALSIPETSGAPFQARNGHSHSCGHDAHTAMLLAAAKIIKKYESTLAGCVKFMFQPAEEILAGAQAMLDDGILENPKVDAALCLHIIAGTDDADPGVIYSKAGALTFSGDAIKIRVRGQDAHGSTPHLGVDAIHIAAHIVLALQNICANEISMKEEALVLVGKIAGGTTVNTVAGHAELDVSIRSTNHQTRQFLKQRIAEIASTIATSFRGKASTEVVYGVPPLINDTALFAQISSHCQTLLGAQNVRELQQFNGSEDFATLAEKIPAILLALGVGGKKQGHTAGLHDPALHIDESALPIGTAVHVMAATRWLADAISNTRTDSGSAYDSKIT